MKFLPHRPLPEASNLRGLAGTPFLEQHRGNKDYERQVPHDGEQDRKRTQEAKPVRQQSKLGHCALAGSSVQSEARICLDHADTRLHVWEFEDVERLARRDGSTQTGTVGSVDAALCQVLQRSHERVSEIAKEQEASERHERHKRSREQLPRRRTLDGGHHPGQAGPDSGWHQGREEFDGRDGNRDGNPDIPKEPEQTYGASYYLKHAHSVRGSPP